RSKRDWSSDVCSSDLVPATAKDVWQEGLTLPPIKFYERGKPREDVIRLYLANLRYRDWLYGDLMAQLGSIWTGRKRLLEVVEQRSEERRVGKECRARG